MLEVLARYCDTVFILKYVRTDLVRLHTCLQESRNFSESNRLLAWDSKLNIAWDIAAALAFLHSLGYAHMDVKSGLRECI